MIAVQIGRREPGERGKEDHMHRNIDRQGGTGNTGKGT